MIFRIIGYQIELITGCISLRRTPSSSDHTHLETSKDIIVVLVVCVVLSAIDGSCGWGLRIIQTREIAHESIVRGCRFVLWLCFVCVWVWQWWYIPPSCCYCTDLTSVLSQLTKKLATTATPAPEMLSQEHTCSSLIAIEFTEHGTDHVPAYYLMKAFRLLIW